MSGAAPGCGVLSVESRTQASVLVVAHPFCDEFFEEPKRLGPTHSLLEDDWVASSRKHLLKSASRGHAMSLPARRSAHFAGPQVRLRRETRRAGDTAGWSLRDPKRSFDRKQGCKHQNDNSFLLVSFHPSVGTQAQPVG